MVTLQGLCILLTESSLLSPRPPRAWGLTKLSWPICLLWGWGGGLRRRRVGPPQVSVTCHERLALLAVTPGLFSLTASCGLHWLHLSASPTPLVTWLHFCLLVPPTPHGPYRKFNVDTAAISYQCPSPFLTSWWPWRILSVLSASLLKNYMAPRTQITQLLTWLHFIPYGKKCTNLWTLRAGFGRSWYRSWCVGYADLCDKLLWPATTMEATTPSLFQTVTKLICISECHGLEWCLVPEWVMSWTLRERGKRGRQEGQRGRCRGLVMEDLGADSLSDEKGDCKETRDLWDLVLARLGEEVGKDRGWTCL